MGTPAEFKTCDKKTVSIAEDGNQPVWKKRPEVAPPPTVKNQTAQASLSEMDIDVFKDQEFEFPEDFKMFSKRLLKDQVIFKVEIFTLHIVTLLKAFLLNFIILEGFKVKVIYFPDSIKLIS